MVVGRAPLKCMEAIELRPLENIKLDEVILLNALVPPKKPMVVITMPTNIENAKAILQKARSVASYIGHEATAKLLSELLSVEVPVNRGEYEPRAGDIAIVVRLKKRLQTPQDLKDIKLEDIEFYAVNYYSDWVPQYE
jgi:hypothetical protein